MTEFSLGQTKVKRVAIIQLRMNKCRVYCGCSFQTTIKLHATEVTNMTEQGLTDGINQIVIAKVRSRL